MVAPLQIGGGLVYPDISGIDKILIILKKLERSCYRIILKNQQMSTKFLETTQLKDIHQKSSLERQNQNVQI